MFKQVLSLLIGMQHRKRPYLSINFHNNDIVLHNKDGDFASYSSSQQVQRISSKSMSVKQSISADFQTHFLLKMEYPNQLKRILTLRCQIMTCQFIYYLMQSL